MQLEASGHVPWWLRLLAATSDDSDSDWDGDSDGDGSETPGSPGAPDSPEHGHGEARPEGLSESDGEGEATSENIEGTDPPRPVFPVTCTYGLNAFLLG